MAVNFAVTDTAWSPNFSRSRPSAPTSITIHHWGADGQTHQGIVNYLCRLNGDSSAHYVASGGRVTQLVHDADRAWHAGSAGNPTSIGIECRPEMSSADFETVARLVAAIRSEWGHLPIYGHRDWMATACPGRWYSRLTALSARADQIQRGTARGTQKGTNEMEITELYKWRDKDGRNLLDQGYEDRRLALTIQNQVLALSAQIAGLNSAVTQLAAPRGIDPGEIKSAIDHAVSTALKDVEITLSTKDNGK